MKFYRSHPGKYAAYFSLFIRPLPVCSGPSTISHSRQMLAMSGRWPWTHIQDTHSIPTPYFLNTLFACFHIPTQGTFITAAAILGCGCCFQPDIAHSRCYQGFAPNLCPIFAQMGLCFVVYGRVWPCSYTIVFIWHNILTT